MHILSELRNPLFDTPDRQRALRALQMSRLLKENNNTKAWSVVKSMIDKVLGEEAISQRSQSASSSNSFVSPPLAAVNNPAPNSPLHVYGDSIVNRMPSAYAYQRSRDSYGTPTAQIVQAPQPMQAQQSQTPQFNWDDINLNNLVGEPEMPGFDWVSKII